MLTTQLTEELALAYLDKSPVKGTNLMLLLNLSPYVADVSAVTSADLLPMDVMCQKRELEKGGYRLVTSSCLQLNHVCGD